MSQATLYLHSAGTVTALGLDTPTVFAAARAGVSRAFPSTMFTVRDPDSGEGQGVTVHEVPCITTGFEGVARLQQLLVGVLKDLKQQTEPQFWNQGTIGVYLALPSAKRAFTGADLLSDEDIQKEWLEKQQQLPDFDAQMVNGMLSQAVALTDTQGDLQLAAYELSGHAAGGTLLGKMQQDANQGRWQQAILIGVDSYLGFHTINWLDYTQRLKSDDNPEAMQPGEAACAIAFSTHPGNQPLAIRQVVQEQESHPLLSGQPSTGKALAQTLFQAAQGMHQQDFQRPWLFTDHNGESYRGAEWGLALTYLKAHRPELLDTDTWFPAISFGEIGSAYIPLALAQAQTALQRRYASAPQAIICAASDNGLRSAIRIGLPNTQP